MAMSTVYAFLFIEAIRGNAVLPRFSPQGAKSIENAGRNNLKSLFNPVLKKMRFASKDANEIDQMYLNEIISRAFKRDYVDDDDDDGDDDGDEDEDEKFIKPKLLERRKRLAEKKRDEEGKIEICDSKLCSEQGICRLYIQTASKVQLCSCYPGYSGEYCQIGNSVTSVIKGHGESPYSLEDKNSQLLDAISSGIKSKIDEDYEDYYESPPEKLSKNAECDSILKIVFSRKPPDETVAILLICILVIAIIITIAIILAVDGDRRVLLERYEVLSRLGYNIDPPDVGFLTLLGQRMTFISCCLCYCCPWMDCCYCVQSTQSFELDIQLASARKRNAQPAASTRTTPGAPSTKSITWAPTTNR